ncbi:DUF3293 domain-containing protein [Streptomyces sp. NPDC046977]|uniref:DUF3293 domain-containing protein n=1 Tax=Streptomyces sp. NPDC046977 TaxID=3154703 RepID=UPI0033D762A2
MPDVLPAPQPGQWSCYLRAVVDIAFPARTLRVAPGSAPHGVRGLPYPLAGGQTIHIVTAFDPAGRATPAEANLRAQHALHDHIRAAGRRWWPAVGGDRAGTHGEISAAVAGWDDTQARALGRRFGQDAVFAWSPTSWRLLACTPAVLDPPPAAWHATLLRP